MFKASILLALAATALPALAREIRIHLREDTCMRTDTGCIRGGYFTRGLTRGGSLEGENAGTSPETAYEFEIPALGGATLRCYFTGATTADVVDFHLSNSANYLRPCGNELGIIMLCEQPYPTCQG